MKIGILTCHSMLNYGANLQLFASVRSLEKMGHQVYVYDNGAAESGLCRDFVLRHFNLTQPCNDDDDYRSETMRLEIDTILVGSDAVLWFLPYSKTGVGVYPNPFWLRWARDLPVRRAVIAGSCMGVMYLKLGRALRNELKKDLEAFDYISVRDNWTMSFLSYIGIQNADLVFDPTSCLPGFTESVLPPLPDSLESGKYLVMTFTRKLNAEVWLAKAAPAIHKAGLKTVFVPHPDRLCSLDNADLSLTGILDPFDWLSVLSNSAGYIGERFHPVILSAFYGKPVLACDYYSKPGIFSLLNRRSKTRDFCNRMGLDKNVVPADSFFRSVNPVRIMERLHEGHSEKAASCGIEFQNALTRATRETSEQMV